MNKFLKTVSLVLLISSCAQFPDYPSPNGMLSLHSVERGWISPFTHRLYTYSQFSNRQGELRELEAKNLKAHTYYVCSYKILSIYVNIYTQESTDCINIEPPVISTFPERNVFVNTYLVPDTNFWFRDTVSNSTLNFITSSELYYRKYYSNTDNVQIDMIFNAIHESYHYLVGSHREARNKVSYEDEEFLANVFAYSLLQNNMSSEQLLHIFRQESSNTNVSQLTTEITRSLNSELKIMRILSDQQLIEEQLSHALNLISN